MNSEKEFVIVTVSGEDRPGITAAFTRILVAHGVELVDIDQATLHDFLGLSFLLDLGARGGEPGARDGVLKDLLFEASRRRMTLQFQGISERELRERRVKNLFVLTFFGGTRALAEMSAILGEERANIVKISNLSRHRAHCLELAVNVADVASLPRLKERLMARSHALEVDLAFQKMETYRKNKRLVFFDMDQTLLDMELVDELAKLAGVHGEVSRVTEKAMRGEIDFEDSLRQRVALLKGLPMTALERTRGEMRLSEGAEDLVRTLKRLGYRMGVVSGGFHFFADALKERLGLDFAYASDVEVRDGALTGRLLDEVIDDAAKAKIVHRVAADMGVPLDQTVAIGDGANDRLMLGQAGLGIAYNARRGLERVAAMSVGRSRLTNILYILGLAEEDPANGAGP